MTTDMTTVTPEATRIGWIGTGVMGLSMCGHLLDAGYKAVVFTRTKAKARPLLEKGASWADSPRAVAEAARQRGAYALDAPVSGGDVGARNAKLSIMVGGNEVVFQTVLPLFKLMGVNIVHQGPAGAGQHAKMCNQIVIAGTMIGVCESLVYAAAAGLEPTKVLESVTKGAANCWSLENLAPRILKGDYAPGFMIDHFIKDMGIALEESRRMGIHLPGLDLVERLYKKASELGHGRDGTQALYQALKAMKP